MRIKNAYRWAALLAVITLFIIAISCGGGSETIAPADLNGPQVVGGNEASESGLGSPSTDQPPGTDQPPSDRPYPDAAVPVDIRLGDKDPDRDYLERDWAQKDQREGHPIFGEIIALTDGSMTIKPEIPDFFREKFDGRETDRPNDLPAEISVILNADTAFYMNGEKLERNPYGVGDKVVVWAYRTAASDRPIAKMVCDYDSFKAKMRERMSGGGDWDGHKRDFAEKHRRMMPRFGTITAVTDNSITIKPEIPDFILRKHDAVPDWDLPESLSFFIDADTEYYVNGEQVRPGAFSVGDKVLIVRRRATDAVATTDMQIAAKICDWAACQKDRPHGRLERDHGGGDHDDGGGGDHWPGLNT